MKKIILVMVLCFVQCCAAMDPNLLQFMIMQAVLQRDAGIEITQEPTYNAKPDQSRLQKLQKFPKLKYQKHHRIHQPRPGF